MDALTHALSPAKSPLRPSPTDGDGSTDHEGHADGLPGPSFEDTVKVQEATKADNQGPAALQRPDTQIAPPDVTPDVEIQPDAVSVDPKPTIIPIADVTGSELTPLAPSDIPTATATLTPETEQASTQLPGAPTPAQTVGESDPELSRMDADLWVAARSTSHADVPVQASTRGEPTLTVDPAAAQAETQTALPVPVTAADADADIRSDRLRPAATPTQPVTAAPGAAPQAVPTTKPAAAPPQAQNQTQVQTQTQPQTQTLAPVTVGVAPPDGNEPTEIEIKTAKVTPVPIADVDGDIEARSSAKSIPTITEPVRPAVDTLRASDLPTINTLPNASSDTLATPKTLPLTPQTPVLTPISGLVERMAANYLQTMPGTTPVTLDKLPQTVVALTMNAQSATLQIDPPELGRIQLEYQFDTQGRTVVTLIPESEAARAALVDRMAAINAALSQGSSGEVDVRMGDAADFTSPHGEGEMGDGTDHQNGSSHPGSDAQRPSSDMQAAPAQYFTRGSSGQTDRLHILV